MNYSQNRIKQSFPGAMMFRLIKLKRRLIAVTVNKNFIMVMALLLGAMVVLAGGWLLPGYWPNYQHTVRSVVNTASVNIGLGIKNIELIGVDKKKASKIYEILNINDYKSLLVFNAEQARARIEEQKWVLSASVRKIYPDVLQVEIRERQPFAIWQNKGEVVLIDRDGMVIGDFTPDRQLNLPLIMGDGANERAFDFFDSFVGFSDLRAELYAASYVGNRRWTLIMKSNVKVMLPEGDVKASLAKLHKLERRTKILEREILAIDLRSPDKVIVQLTERGFKQHNLQWRAKLKMAPAGGGGG